MADDDEKDPDHYLDLPVGQLNSLYDKFGDPFNINVIPEGANPVDIAKYALAKITERRVPEQETYHAKVLHAKGNIFAKPGTYGAVLDYLGIGETRTMAICRIIEKHSCIPDPDLNRDPKTGDMTSYDKMCLNLHAQAATYYTAPGTDLPDLDAGDIVMVMPKDRLILRIVEKSPHGPGQRDRGPAARGLFEDGAVVLAEDFVAHVSPDASAFVSKMKASDLGNFSNEFLLGLAANAQHESGFCANNAGDPNTTVSGERAHAIEKPDCKSRIRKFCSFGYWQMNICGKASDTTYGGVRFAIYYGIDINDKETLYAAITDPDKQFEFMYHDAQTLLAVWVMYMLLKLMALQAKHWRVFGVAKSLIGSRTVGSVRIRREID